MYDRDEDLSHWTFDQFFAHSQWHETDLFLRHDIDNFSGPQPGPILPRTFSPLEYFRRYWLDDVLDYIIVETNRYASIPFLIFNFLSFVACMSAAL
jgi:hypothetical protein